MKRLILAAVTFLLMAGCGSKPPEPAVTVGAVQVPALLSTHCWKVCADYPAPPDHLRAAGYQAAAVPPGGTARVQFSSAPVGVTLNRWTEREAETLVRDARGPVLEFKLPDAPGFYTYSVSGQWQRGSASYVFQVEVRQP
jgi:hypothetical protein